MNKKVKGKEYFKKFTYIFLFQKIHTHCNNFEKLK